MVTVNPAGISLSSGPRVRDLTMVFTDIEASTHKVVQLGDIRWCGLISTHHRIIRRRLVEFGGAELSAMGDGFLLAFDALGPALRCMEAVQRDIRGFVARHPEQEIHVRMGIHTGETIVAPDGSLTGRDVHVASRVAGAANGGEILVSDEALDRARAAVQTRFDNVRRAPLKGLAGVHTLHVAEWE